MRLLLLRFEATVLRGHQRQGRCAWLPPWQQGLGAAAHPFLRHRMLRRKLPQERVLAGQEVRHHGSVPSDLRDVFAVVEPVLVAALHQHEFLAPDVRLAQIHRIGGDRHLRQQRPMPHPMLHDRGAIALWNAGAPEEAGLDVRGRDREDVAVPVAGRKPHERVRRIIRRVRPAIHPDGAVQLERTQIHLDGQKLLRIGIALLRDAELIRPEEDIRERVRRALVLEHRVPVRAPAVRVETASLVERDAAEVAGLLSGHAIRLIFVIAARPIPHEAHLRERRRSRREHDGRDDEADKRRSAHQFLAT